MCTDRRHLVRPAIVDWFLPLWATSPFEDLQDPWFLLVPLGNGTLGRRVAPLSVSMHIYKCVSPSESPG